MLDIRLAHRISDLASADWDRLVGARPFAAQHWFSFLEDAAHDYEPRYLLAYESGEPVAAAVYALRRQDDIPLPRPLRDLLGAYIRQRPLLSCQNCLFSRSAFFLSARADAAETARQVIAATAELARHEHCSFVTFDYLPAGPELRALQSVGLRSVGYPDEPGAFLALPGSDFQGYLHTLKRDRRQNLTRLMRRAEEAGVRVEVTRDLVRERVRVCELVRRVYSRHQERQLPAPEAIIHSAATHIPDGALLVLAYLEDTLAGCCFVLKDGTEAALRILGLDYELDQAGHVYRSVIVEAIRHCAETGIRRVDGGSTAYTFKDRLGFELESTAVAFTSANPLLRVLGNLAARMV